MRATSDKSAENVRNAWGGYHDRYTQTFEVEAADVGTVRPDHRGQGHATHRFTSQDVGREITVYTDGKGWTCWVFAK